MTEFAAAGILGVAAWWDIRRRVIPNWCVVLILLCGILRVLTHGATLLWAVSGLLTLAVPMLLFAVLLGDGIGGGDVKLCGAIGFLLGPVPGLMLVLFSLCGLVLVGKITKASTLPFAPFVLVAYVLILIFWR